MYRAEIYAVLPHFCLCLVAMATPFAPLKTQTAYLNSLMSQTYYSHGINFSIPCTELKSVQFCLIFAKVGCHGNCPCSPKKSDGIFEFADPENHILHAKSVSISCTELKSVQFWFIFAQIWLPWQPPFLP